MSLPRYPNYKDSGVEWLGEVPEHWEVVPLKHVIQLIESGVSVNSTDTPAVEGESGVLKTSCVYHGHFDADKNKAVVPEEYGRLACPVTVGTLIVSRMNTPDLVGAAGLVRQSRANLFLPDRLWQIHFIDADPAYVHYWSNTPSYRAQVEMVCAGTSSSMQNLSQGDFRSFALTAPPLPEQTQIAAFLDRETAKIDELVAEQRRLMELLKEKRQAVISHAVTQGLNPDAPMKPSGIEWLGEVPEHWDILKLKDVAIFCGGGTPSRENLTYWNGDIPWVSPKDMKVENLMGAEESITAEGLSNSTATLIAPGRVLMVVRSGILKHTIPVAITGIPVAMNQDMKALHFQDGRCLSRFFFRWVQGLNDLLLLAWAKQGATVESIEQTYLANTILPLPSPAEQTEIIAFLETELEKFDTLTTEAQRAITLLQERRTALISAAVTGQIDVRGAVAA